MNGDKRIGRVVLPMEWAVSCHWERWQRCLWLGVQIDLSLPAIAVVLFGLVLHAGRRVKLYDWRDRFVDEVGPGRTTP